MRSNRKVRSLPNWRFSYAEDSVNRRNKIFSKRYQTIWLGSHGAISYQISWHLESVFRWWIASQRTSFDLFARHEALGNATGSIDVCRNDTDNQIKYTENTANDECDEIPKYIKICLAHRLPFKSLLTQKDFCWFLLRTRSKNAVILTVASTALLINPIHPLLEATCKRLNSALAKLSKFAGALRMVWFCWLQAVKLLITCGLKDFPSLSTHWKWHKVMNWPGTRAWMHLKCA